MREYDAGLQNRSAMGFATCSIIIIMSDKRGRSERGSSRARRERQRQKCNVLKT